MISEKLASAGMLSAKFHVALLAASASVANKICLKL